MDTKTGIFESGCPAEPGDIKVGVVPAATLNPTVRDPVAVYLAGLSPASRRTMRGALRIIATLVTPEADERSLPWASLDYAQTSAIRASVATKFAPATANRMLAAMRGVLRAAFKLGLMSSDQMTRACSVTPARGIRLPKGRALSEAELRALFASCDRGTVGGARNAALLGVLYGVGLRRAEIVGLDLADFDARADTLLIRGKGNKQRRGFVSNGSRQALCGWLAVRGQEPGPLFFPVTQGGAIERRRLSDQAVAELVRRLARRAKVARFSPHDVRRTFIGDLLDAGVDLPTVQALAGHSSPTTTAGYDRRGDRARRRASELLHVPVR